VTPEYNHGICGALKNAIDFLFPRVEQQGSRFVGYGRSVGARRGALAAGDGRSGRWRPVRNQVALSLFTDFENYTKFNRLPHQEEIGESDARSIDCLERCPEGPALLL